MKRSARLFCLEFCVVIFSLMLAITADSAEKEVKITGTLISAPADPGGKFAPVAVECKDGVYAVINNAVAKKMLKKIGKKMDVTGVVTQTDGKKVIEPWLFLEAGAKPRPQPTG